MTENTATQEEMLFIKRLYKNSENKRKQFSIICQLFPLIEREEIENILGLRTIDD